MRFLRTPEQEQFAASLRELLADAGSVAVARSWAAGETEPGLDLWARLADQGVAALLVPEDGTRPLLGASSVLSYK